MASRRGLSKAQLKVLATARGLLRHVNQNVNNKRGYPLRKDVKPWTSYIMEEYRRAQNIKDRSEQRRLRTMAQEVLAGLQSVSHQQDLFFRYGGLDVDSKEYRRAAAHRVGVTIPDSLPVREFDAKAKYNLAARMDVMGTGLEGLKAQLFRKPSEEEAAGSADAAAAMQQAGADVSAGDVSDVDASEQPPGHKQ